MHRPAELDPLLERLRALESTVVAFSAGVDSTLVLRACVEALGRQRVLAVTGRSPAVPPWELEDAPGLAEACGADHVFVDTQELESPDYVANAPDRCYHCKTELFGTLEPIRLERGLRCIVDGTNTDDLGDHRPGMRARRERDIVSPLVDAGLDKAAVRRLSRYFGLDTAEKPALACLASRFPYGTEVTREGLARVGAAELAIRALGFENFRVRHHDDLARLEVDPGDLDRAAVPAMRSEIARALKGVGYRWVALDLDGYRSGSLNDVLVPATIGVLRPSTEPAPVDDAGGD